MQYVESDIPHFEWLDNPRCIAGFSTRKGGVSSGVYASMNVGLHSKDEHENVLENRSRLFQQVAPQFKILNLHQIHSADVIRADASFINDYEADGFFTTEKGRLLTISILGNISAQLLSGIFPLLNYAFSIIPYLLGGIPIRLTAWQFRNHTHPAIILL